jgi:ElaB/YqjD/DUF883 family membrane-anchored ribosome-binding protein
MEQEPEVIKKEIERTSSSLKDKVEQLEEQVIGTVKEATDTVGETIETVKETVHSTVEAVKRTFDLRYQVEQHPWAMVGGSVLAGFAAGKLFDVGVRRWRRPGGDGRAAPSLSTVAAGRYRAAEPFPAATTPPAPRPAGPSLFTRLFQNFEPEINQLKATAIGTVFGLVRDTAKRSLPESLAPKVDEVLNNLTTKLGGEVIHGPVTSRDGGGGYRA